MQLVFPRVTADNAALKLTIAQYLTPGDYSIQGVGVAPDIELDPMTADTLEMDLYRVEHGLRERDSDEEPEQRREAQRRSGVLPVALQPAPGGARPDPRARRRPRRRFRARFTDQGRSRRGEQAPARPEVGAAAQREGLLEKLQQTRSTRSAPIWRSSGSTRYRRRRTSQGGLLSADYEVGGLDRSPERPGRGRRAAGAQGERSGTRASSRSISSRSLTKSDNAWLYDEKELAFGMLKPGETKSQSGATRLLRVRRQEAGFALRPWPINAKRSCKLPSDTDTRSDVLRVRFFAGGLGAPRDAECAADRAGAHAPVFAYNYQVADNRPGNGDGQLA